MEFASQWPLVGRVGELRQLQRLLGSSEQRGAVIVGPPGVGKTRLARECLALAERSGSATAWVTATRSAAGLPFGAIAPLLPAPPSGDEGPAENRTDLLRRSAAALADAARGRPLTLVVDDAHLLDDASATLVYQLAVNRTAFVLLTVRAGEPAPDPVTALWKDGLAVRLELRGLPADAVAEILATVLDGQVDPATSALFTIHCEGNALFLRELVVGARQDGSLVNDAGIWRHTGALSPSERLVELVETRLGSLSPEERNLLELVSYAEPLGAAELGALSSADVAEVLERRGLMASFVDGRRLQLRAAHPLYSDVVRARIPAIRLRTIARSLADALEVTGTSRREDPLRVATWRLDGGGVADPALMLSAAATARWRYDFALAERLGVAAVAAGAGFGASLLVAHLASLQGRTNEAEEQLARLAPQAATEGERVQATLVRLENLLFALGRAEEALVVADEAEAAITDPAWRAEIAAIRCGILMATAGFRAAADSAGAVLDSGVGRAVILASNVASFSLARLGRCGAALEAARKGEEAHRSVSLPSDWYPWFSQFVRCEGLVQAGRIDEAHALARQEYSASLQQGSTEGRAFFAWALARPVAERGDVDVAIGAAREGVSLFRQLGRPAFELNALVPLALSLALAGRGREAGEALEAIEALAVGPGMWVAVELLQARAMAALAGGRLTLARDLLVEVVRCGQAIGDLVGVASALHTLARLGRPDEHAPELAAVAADIEGDLAPARAAHGLALARNDPEALTAVSVQFDHLGATLLAAYAAVDAYRLWDGAGDARSAATRARAVELAARCPGAAISGLRGGDPDRRLTPAETEAARLDLSSRTELAALFSETTP